MQKKVINDFEDYLGSVTGPKRKARELMIQAFEQEDMKKGVKLAKKAAYIYPDCSEAYIYLAEADADSVGKAESCYRKASEAAKREIGDIRELKLSADSKYPDGTFVYLLAESALASFSIMKGEFEEAVERYWGLLDFNPGDEFGSRYMLAQCLFELEEYEELERLWNRYRSDRSAVWLYSRALLSSAIEGYTRTSISQLKKAVKSNPHIPQMLLDPDLTPDEEPESWEAGSEDEAAIYVWDYADHWENLEGSLEWLSDVTGIEMPDYDLEGEEDADDMDELFDITQTFSEETKKRLDDVLTKHKCLRNSDDIFNIIHDSHKIGGLPRPSDVVEQVFSPEDQPTWNDEKAAKEFYNNFLLLWNQAVATEKLTKSEAKAILFSLLPEISTIPEYNIQELAKSVIFRHDRILLFLRFLEGQGKMPEKLPQNACKHLAYWDKLIEETASFIKKKGKKAHPTELKRIAAQIEEGDEMMFELFKVIDSGEDITQSPSNFPFDLDNLD